MKRLSILFLTVSLIMTTLSPVTSSASTPVADASPEAISDSELDQYIGQMKVVQALLMTVAPLFVGSNLGEGDAYETLGALQTLLWVDAFLSRITPPAFVFERHTRFARSVTGAAIGARMLQDGLRNSDDGSITVGFLTVQVGCESIIEELTLLFEDIGIEPSEALVPVDYGGDTSSTDDNEDSGSSDDVDESFTGQGDSAVSVSLRSGLARISATHAGSGNFIVTLYGPQGQRELIVNEIGSYSGTRAIPIEASGAHTIDIQADGAWTLSIEQ